MRRNKGFTLVELLVAVAILGIMLAVAITALGKARHNWTLRGEINEFMMTFYRARALAMKDESIVRIHFDSISNPRRYWIQEKEGSLYIDVKKTSHSIPAQASYLINPQVDIVFLPDGRMVMEQGTGNYVLTFFTVRISMATIPQHYFQITLYPMGGVETTRHFVK